MDIDFQENEFGKQELHDEIIDEVEEI